MSNLVLQHIQLGDDADPNKNFTIMQGRSGGVPDGRLIIARGNVGATGSNIWEVDANGNLSTNLKFVPSGNIASTNINAAVQELDSEKLATAGGTVTGNLTVNGITSANRIQFPATMVSSSDPNTLDDYEEGSFFMSDYSSANLSLGGQINYVKIGRFVSCSFSISYPTTSDMNNAFFNLPFTAASSASGSCIQGGSGLANKVWIAMWDSPNRAGFMKGTGQTRATNADMNFSTVEGTISYISV